MAHVTVITGGAGGMGLATAKIIGKDNIVVLCDVNQERLDAAKTELEGLGITAETITSDITDKASVSALIAKAQSFGSVRSVIHTAGVSPQMGKADLIMKINVLGTLNINEGFLKIATDGFVIVNVASMGGYQIPSYIAPTRSYPLAFSDHAKLLKKLIARANLLPKKLRSGIAYTISKNFVIWYSKAAAEKFGDKGARILSVSPGSIDTRMGKLEKDHGAGSMADISALKRFGRPDEIAEVLAFCASDKASYLTGIDILCDGGTIAAYTIGHKRPNITL